MQKGKMNSKYKKIDLNKIKTISILERKSKVNIGDFSKIFESFQNFKISSSIAGQLLSNSTFLNTF